MKISAKAEYACVALVELAARYPNAAPVSLKGVAEQYGISPAFLTQVFLQLKAAGIVTSARGSAGGYQLAREPDAIRLDEVIESIDGPAPESTALDGLDKAPVTAALQGVWSQVVASQKQILHSISLADLVRQCHEAGVAFYQI